MTTVRETAAAAAGFMYAGERCVYCGHEYKDGADINARRIVRAKVDGFWLACGDCHEKSQKEGGVK